MSDPIRLERAALEAIRHFYLENYGYDVGTMPPPPPACRVGDYRLATDGVDFRIEQLMEMADRPGLHWVPITDPSDDRAVVEKKLAIVREIDAREKRRGAWHPVQP
jgi:hypothetical protein